MPKDGPHVSRSAGAGSRRASGRALRGGNGSVAFRKQEANLRSSFASKLRLRPVARAVQAMPRGVKTNRHVRFLFRPREIWLLSGPMDFQTVLKEVVENTDGGLATLLMDFEGIPVDSYSKPEAPFDITTIGVEFSVVLKSIQRAAQMLEAGETAEIAIQAEKVTTLIRIVSDSYFVAFSMTPDANIGKARYMLRTRVPLIKKELA